jgi:septum formation inhibitor-activating ATPase MinD
MREVELAIAMSARDWAQGLHRFLDDHGGARVRLRVLGADEALAEAYDILIIDDISSLLTPRLIDQVRRRGRHVIGVYDPDEHAEGKDRLLDCGVDDVVEAGADAEEFLRVISRLGVALMEAFPADRIEEKAPSQPVTTRARPIVVGAPPGGCGATEVAIAIARRLSLRHGPTVLVDGDDSAPSLAQRLGLTLHPNLRAGIDAVQHRTGLLASSLQQAGGFEVLAGLSSGREWLEVRPPEVIDVVDELCATGRRVVVNIGSQLEALGVGDGGRFGISRGLVESAGVVVGVGLSSPVGVARLLAWMAEVRTIAQQAPVHLLINRTTASQYRRGEVLDEIARSCRPASVGFLPADDAVTAAAWAGRPLDGGRFSRSVSRFVDQRLSA